ncbi:hypothetical protein EJB05_32987, partial [Eragrostis curvula]
MGRRRRFAQQEEDDEKDLEAMRRDDDDEETGTHRRHDRPRKRSAPESDEEEAEPEEQQEEEEEPDDEENAEAVPIGDPVKVTGTGKKHYASFKYEGITFELEDTVLLAPEDLPQKPHVAIIKDITETEESLNVTVQRFYRPEEAERKDGGSWPKQDTREIFYSFHMVDVPAESVMHKCVVHFIPLPKQIPRPKQLPGFVVQKVYDAVEKKLCNLCQQGHEDKLQEIDSRLEMT